jgi:ABC-type enterochelin transport system permease subunit
LSTAEESRPYDDIFDPAELAALEVAVPGSAGFVLGMIKSDMEWQQERQTLLDARSHASRTLSIWLTVAVVLSIAGMATACILTNHQVAGSILATVDLVALANTLVNAWRGK